jgi:hypothetical protein
MMRRSLLLVGLAALVIALAMTGALSMLSVGEMVEVFPLPPETLDLPLPAQFPSQPGMVLPEATVVAASGPTSTAGLLSAAVQPTTAILQAGRDGYTGCSDTYIQFYLPTDNFCESPELYVVTSNKAATLLRFDLTNLPETITGLNSDAVVLEATLDIYAVQGNEGVLMGIYLPYGPWDPCTVTWDTPWESPGADGLSDREHDPRAEGTMQQATGWMTFDVTGLVQYWLREPTQNYGMIIKSFDVSVPSHHIFFSSDHPGEDVRPQLTIKYEPALPTPIPTETAASGPTPTATAMPASTPTTTHTAIPASTSAETPSAVPTSTAAPLETATPTVIPLLTPTLILPLSPRVIELHWQNEMNIGGSYPIQVIFRPETAAMGGSTQSYLLSVFAQVTAAAFDVVQNTPAEQVLQQPEDTLSWSWQVEPRMVGSQTLSLDLLFSWRPATSTAAGITSDSGTWYQTKVIKVIRPFRYWTHVTVLRNLLLSIATGCLVGWYVLRRRTRGRLVDH